MTRLGWDGGLVLACSLVVVTASVIRGVRGLEPWIALVLAVDATYLGLAWWRRG